MSSTIPLATQTEEHEPAQIQDAVIYRPLFIYQKLFCLAFRHLMQLDPKLRMAPSDF